MPELKRTASGSGLKFRESALARSSQSPHRKIKEFFMRTSFLVVFTVIALARTGYAEPAPVSIHSGLAEEGWFKVSGGFLVAFNGTQKYPRINSIEVFDRQGRRLAGLDVLGQLPGASSISLDDVAAREGRAIVVGGTMRNAAGGLQDLLLYFSWNGRLERSVYLPPEQEISKIELDEEGEVWTLTDYFGRGDDTKGPLIFVYDGTGKLLKGLLRRTDYPAGLREDPRRGGVSGFGLTVDGVWFWEPARLRMTVINRSGKVLKQESVALPKSHLGQSRSNPPESSFVGLLPSGQIATGIISPLHDVPTGAYISRGKRFVRGSDETLWLIGVDGTDFVFLKPAGPGSNEYQVLREPRT